MRTSRWPVIAAVFAVLALGACTEGDADGASAEPDTSPQASTSLAGELGSGGGVLWDGREMQSTPDQLFEYQEDSAPTVVFTHPSGVDPHFYLGAVRRDDSVCVSLSPAGEEGPVSQLCDVPAYRSPDEVVDHSFIAEGDISLEGAPTRVLYGVTYLDATSVSLANETVAIDVQKGLPFWMHRFFAIAIPENADGDLRLLDADGIELARIPLPSA